jgi:hypothetical protein
MTGEKILEFYAATLSYFIFFMLLIYINLFILFRSLINYNIIDFFN